MQYKHVFAICAYKDSPYLEACIRSLIGQHLKTQVILCTSTPSPYIDGLGEKYQIPVYVREGEPNIRDDWNFASHMADADLVTIAHQDDVYHPDYTRALFQAYGAYPDLSLFTTDYVVVKNGKVVKDEPMLWVKRALRLPLRLRFLANRTWLKKFSLCLGNPICCPATTYNKRVLGEKLFHSDYRFALDWDNLLDLARRPGRFVCEERPLLYYRVHDGATTKACIKDQSRAEEEFDMFCRFWPKPIAQAIMKIYRLAYREYDEP